MGGKSDITKKQDVRLPTGQSQYMVVGRYVPTTKYPEKDQQCKVYRMKLFAKNKTVARSRFWYFMGRLTRVKKANGQIISVNQVHIQQPRCLSIPAPSHPSLNRHAQVLCCSAHSPPLRLCTLSSSVCRRRVWRAQPQPGPPIAASVSQPPHATQISHCSRRKLPALAQPASAQAYLGSAYPSASHPHLDRGAPPPLPLQPVPSPRLPHPPLQIFEKDPLRVKNFGFWFRYESRTGTHNAYKEFRALTLTSAVNSLCKPPPSHPALPTPPFSPLVLKRVQTYQSAS